MYNGSIYNPYATPAELADIEEWYIVKQDSDFGMNAILADQE